MVKEDTRPFIPPQLGEIPTFQTYTVARTVEEDNGPNSPYTVPGPGIIVVNANPNIHHANGDPDYTDVWIGTSPDDCTYELGCAAGAMYAIVAPETLSNTTYPWFTMRELIHIPTGGTMAFYVTGRTTGTPGTATRADPESDASCFTRQGTAAITASLIAAVPPTSQTFAR